MTLGTVFVSLILLAVVILIVLKLVKDNKKGKSSCGCNCAHCAMANQCKKDPSAPRREYRENT